MFNTIFIACAIIGAVLFGALELRKQRELAHYDVPLFIFASLFGGCAGWFFGAFLVCLKLLASRLF
jgi:hypothetical protein